MTIHDWLKGILAAVNHSGDSHSTESITGAILETRLGIGAIPERWIRRKDGTLVQRQLIDPEESVLIIFRITMHNPEKVAFEPTLFT